MSNLQVHPHPPKRASELIFMVRHTNVVTVHNAPPRWIDPLKTILHAYNAYVHQSFTQFTLAHLYFVICATKCLIPENSVEKWKAMNFWYMAELRQYAAAEIAHLIAPIYYTPLHVVEYAQKYTLWLPEHTLRLANQYMLRMQDNRLRANNFEQFKAEILDYAPQVVAEFEYERSEPSPSPDPSITPGTTSSTSTFSLADDPRLDLARD